MEGIEAAVVKRSQLNGELRCEAGFFKKRYLIEDRNLSRWPKLIIGEFAHVTDGQHGYHEVDDSSPIVMLTAKNARDWFSDREDANHIAVWVDEKNRRSSLEVGDVILSTRGTVGMCSLVIEEALPANIDQDVARISWSKRERFLPEFVVAYLNSTFGQDHINRHASGMVQQGLSLQKVREIPLPLISIATQTAIANTVHAALRLRREAVRMSYEAEQILLLALGLEGWQPPEPQTYTRRASKVFAAGRLDAEYFQPKYHALLERITNNAVRCKRVEEFATFCDRGTQPEYFEDGNLSVINSRHILENGLHYDNFERTRENCWYQPKFVNARIYHRDILTYTTGANVGRTAAYLSEEPALASNHVNILRLLDENPVFVAVVMNSFVGRSQTMMLVTGSAQAELYPADILSFLIPFVDSKSEQTITKLVEGAHCFRLEAHALLERAKRAVEIAIEESEEAALDYLKEVD